MQVDLAGSERIKDSGSEGVRLTEAQVQIIRIVIQTQAASFAFTI